MLSGKYKKAFNVSLQNLLEYKFNFLMTFLFTLIPFFVNVLIWCAVSYYSTKSIVMGKNDIITYYFINLIFSNIVICNVYPKISEDIRLGGLNKYLIKPMNYLYYQLVVDLPERIVFLFMGSVPVILIGICLRKYIAIQFSVRLALFFIAFIFIGYVINYLFTILLTEGCFYFTKVDSLYDSFIVCKNIVSGDLIPLKLMPHAVFSVLSFLPFKYVSYTPIMVLLGEYKQAKMLRLLLEGGVWCIVLYIAVKILWVKGVKRYQAFGG